MRSTIHTHSVRGTRRDTLRLGAGAGFRAAFLDLGFSGTVPLIADGVMALQQLGLLRKA